MSRTLTLDSTFLLSHGADPTIRDTDGMTAEEGLRRNGLVDIADFLRQKRQEGQSASY
jgi:uncharacterized protein